MAPRGQQNKQEGTKPAAPAQDPESDQAPAQDESQAPVTPPAATPPAIPEPESPAPPRPAVTEVPKVLVREKNGQTDKRAVALLLDACETYGVNPDGELPLFVNDRETPGPGPFRELLEWAFYGGDRRTGTVDAVVLVTAGGLKIRHHRDPNVPMDAETEERLRRVFNAYTVDPTTKNVIALPLPADLTLPASAVDGRVHSSDHLYVGGYLKGGGKREAARRGR